MLNRYLHRLFFPYVFYYLFFQKRKITNYHIPYDIIVYLKILMNNIISHAIYQLPRSIGMCIAKFFSKHIRSFTYNLDILYHSIIHHIISDEIIKSLSFCITHDTFYGLQYVFKPTFISNSFSHTLRFYLVLQTL